jgi:hypothetical protein
VSNGASALPSWQAVSVTQNYTKISSVTASNSASITFTGLSASYGQYIIYCSNMLPATNAVLALIRTSTNNGVSYDSGAGNYAWSNVLAGAGAPSGAGSYSDTGIYFGATSGSLNNSVASNMQVLIDNPSAAQQTLITLLGQACDSSGSFPNGVFGYGRRFQSTAVNAIQITMSSGNITSGTFTLYGVTP